jgi:AhpD family alkylhydroperoxidase
LLRVDQRTAAGIFRSPRRISREAPEPKCGARYCLPVFAPSRSPRTFTSPGEVIRELVGVARRARPLATAYTRGGLDPALRERVMVAVSRVNSCRGCTFVHVRLAGRAGVSADDLQAIGVGDLGGLDERNRAAVAYAAALAEARFRGPIAADLAAGASDHLTAAELAAVDAAARAMALANLSANTIEELFGRLRSLRATKPNTH